jgi:hypothetical protein
LVAVVAAEDAETVHDLLRDQVRAVADRLSVETVTNVAAARKWSSLVRG